MDPERFRRIDDLFHRALAQPPDRRAAYVAAVAGGDVELRREVERLLRADPHADDLVERLDVFGVRLPDPLIGASLGAWRVVSRIAEGGMGVVYRAVRADDLFEQDVAIKLLRIETATADAVRRFDAERRTLAQLQHPNIARLLDGGTTAGGTPYLVMELIDGQPIDRWCDARQLTVEERLQVFQVVCHAVHFAHRSLVVHRDLKPSNVLVDDQGIPKLLDFGIARLLDEEGEVRTHTGARVLTPEYASPEQLQGAPLTTASDVYSLGVMLYQMLTGRRPLQRTGHSPGDWERTVVETPPTRPSTAVLRGEGEGSVELAARLRSTPARLRRRLRGDLDRIVLMALRKEPERRYASVEQLAEDLQRFLAGHPVRARDDTVWYRAHRFVRRNALSVASVVLIVLGLVGTLVATWLGEQRAERAAAVARSEQQRAEATAAHARIEADSFRSIADFLGDTFLAAVPLEAERSRLQQSIAQHADQVRRQHRDAPHLRANLLDALGKMAVRLDLFDQADALLTEAYDLRLRTFGQDSLEVALSLASLGSSSYRRGDFDVAAARLEQALALHRRLPDGVHTDVATAANDLAAALRNLGQTERARTLHEEALQRRRQDVGDGTLPVAESRNNLACVLLDLGEIEAAAEHAAAAMETRRRILGDGHPLTLQAMVTLAGAAWRRGDLERAGPLLQQAADGYRALRAGGAEGLGHVLANLAAVLTQRGDVAAARPVADEAVAWVRDRLGPDHPQVASALAVVATLSGRQRDFTAARRAWEEVVRIRRAAYPEHHALLATALIGYGTLLVQAHDLPAAEPTLREALTLAASLEPPNQDLVARAEMTLGVCVAGRGDVEAGRAMLQRAVSRFESVVGVDSEPARVARQHLARLPH